jgi:hypothetical protein
MVIQYTSIFHCKSLQNFPKVGFLVWNCAIWQPWCAWKGSSSEYRVEQKATRRCKTRQGGSHFFARCQFSRKMDYVLTRLYLYSLKTKLLDIGAKRKRHFFHLLKTVQKILKCGLCKMS